MLTSSGPIVINTRAIINSTRLAFRNYEEAIEVDYEKMLFVVVGLLSETDYAIEVDDLISEVFDTECLVFDNDRDLLVIGKPEGDDFREDEDVMTMNVTNILARNFLCPLIEALQQHEYFSRQLRHYVFSHVTSTNDVVLEPRKKERSGV